MNFYNKGRTPAEDTMKFFGQTLKDFRVYEETNNIYLFTAPSGDKWNNRNLKTRAYFDAKTNKIRKSIEGLLIERAKKQGTNISKNS